MMRPMSCGKKRIMFCESLLVVVMATCCFGEAKRSLNGTDYVEDDGDCRENRIGVIDGECPSWTWPCAEDPGCCNVGGSPEGAVQWSDQNLSILSGYCMTYDSSRESFSLAICPYGFDPMYMFNHNRTLPPNASLLNSAMCDPLHRESQLCGRCKPGYGVAVYSDNVNCYRCSGPYQGWALYLALELLPITFMLFFLLIFQCRILHSSFNCFVFFAQVISFEYQFIPPKGSFPFGKTSEIINIIYGFSYGIFNCDFFKKLVPPFCVSEGLDGLNALSLLYLSMLYILLFIIVSYAVIQLHTHNCRALVVLWRPCNKYMNQMLQRINPTSSLVQAFATSFLLSYSRLLYTSILLLRPMKVYSPNGQPENQALFFDGRIGFFSRAHWPYALLSISTIFFFNIVPALFLLVYPMKSFQRVLGRVAFGNILCGFHAFADAFQGCYKNRRTDGARDCRYFSALYLFLRVAVCLGPGIPIAQSVWIVPTVLFLIMSLLFAHIRPYRQDIFNTVDSIAFAGATVFSVSRIIIGFQAVEDTFAYQVFCQLVMGVPLCYFVCQQCLYLYMWYNRWSQKRK